MPNPCANGKCIKLGSFGYDCICGTGYQGYNCEKKINWNKYLIKTVILNYLV